MTAPTAAKVKCPRCNARLVRNHDELVCLTHGQAYEAIRAWENVPAYEPVPGRPRQAPPRDPVVPWTEDERELWRRAEAGEVFEPDHEEEEREPMTEMSFRTVDDLAKPTLARLKDIVSEIATKERELVGLRDDGKRFVAVLEALRVEVPEAVRDGIRPLDGKHRMVAESERWTCVCGWKSKGRFPGGHTSRCAAHKATVAMEEPHD
jgi:hypothetical protein